MIVLSEHSVFILVSQLGLILLAARIFGELAVRFGQPIIVGEVIAGIVLGPSILGHFLPDFHHALFPTHGYQPYLLQAISWLCVIFLLLITGLEIDLRASLRQGKQGVYISLIALLACFTGCMLAATLLPDALYIEGTDRLQVNLLCSIALSVVAIPVIAKILFDLKILKSEVGLKILTSGVLSDIWGWSVLAVIIALIAQGDLTLTTVLKPLLTMIIYLGCTLTFGYKLVDKFLNVIGYQKMDTSVTLSLLFSLALINGAIAHLLGIHVIFGAFVAGLMAGESEKISPYLRQWTQDFIFAVFAPIFFVIIGMQLRFTGPEIIFPVILLLLVSSIFRIFGAYFGAILGGLGNKNAFAVACGLNTQGTMGVIVALIGYEMKIFNDQMFSSIVIVCVLTSLFVGPLLKWAIRGVKRPLAKFFDEEHVFLDIEGQTKKEVIAKIVQLMKGRKLIDDESAIEKAIWERENTLSTAIGEGVALPHARIANLKEPILCFFRLRNAVDFGSPDDKPVQILFLELTDSNDDGMQLNLIAQVARLVSSQANRVKLLTCQNSFDVHHILSFDEKA